MHPVIHLGQFDLLAYNLFFFLGATIVLCGGTWLASQKGLAPKNILIVLVITAILSLVGARIFHVIIDLPFYQQNPSLLFNLNFQGQAIYGGLITFILSLWFLSRQFNLPYWQLLDCLTPFLGLGLAIGRIGCFLAGCCFGKETNLPWGVSFPLLSPVHKFQLSQNIGNFFHSHTVHPTQVYEIIVGIFIAIMAGLLLKKQYKPGITTLIAGIVYTVFRLVNDFWRTPSATFAVSIYFYPVFYLVIIIFLLIILVKRKNSREC